MDRPPLCASSAVSVSYGVIQATEACASRTARLSLGTRACVSGATHPSHVPRTTKIVAQARRSFHRGCATLSSPDRVVTVALRCGKADKDIPRSRLKLDFAFPRRHGGANARAPMTWLREITVETRAPLVGEEAQAPVAGGAVLNALTPVSLLRGRALDARPPIAGRMLRWGCTLFGLSYSLEELHAPPNQWLWRKLTVATR